MAFEAEKWDVSEEASALNSSLFMDVSPIHVKKKKQRKESVTLSQHMKLSPKANKIKEKSVTHKATSKVHTNKETYDSEEIKGQGDFTITGNQVDSGDLSVKKKNKRNKYLGFVKPTSCAEKVVKTTIDNQSMSDTQVDNGEKKKRLKHYLDDNQSEKEDINKSVSSPKKRRFDDSVEELAEGQVSSGKRRKKKKHKNANENLENENKVDRGNNGNLSCTSRTKIEEGLSHKKNKQKNMISHDVHQSGSGNEIDVIVTQNGSKQKKRKDTEVGKSSDITEHNGPSAAKKKKKEKRKEKYIASEDLFNQPGNKSDITKKKKRKRKSRKNKFKAEELPTGGKQRDEHIADREDYGTEKTGTNVILNTETREQNKNADSRNEVYNKSDANGSPYKQKKLIKSPKIDKGSSDSAFKKSKKLNDSFDDERSGDIRKNHKTDSITNKQTKLDTSLPFTPKQISKILGNSPKTTLVTQKDFDSTNKNHKQKHKIYAHDENKNKMEGNHNHSVTSSVPSEEPHVTPKGQAKKNKSEVKDKKSHHKSLLQLNQERLEAARFRFINEQLYMRSGEEAFELFKEDPEAFEVYHKGFQNQVEKWPVNPLDIIIKFIKTRPTNTIVADFGCGDAKLAQSVPNKVHSFDLVALNKHVTVCDVSSVPLSNETVDIAVFCLSLMGTNFTTYLTEANRVLKKGGTLVIAEVASRFGKVKNFTANVEKLGFKSIDQDTENTMFVLMKFKKKSELKTTVFKQIKLKPCLYKKR